MVLLPHLTNTINKLSVTVIPPSEEKYWTQVVLPCFFFAFDWDQESVRDSDILLTAIKT